MSAARKCPRLPAKWLPASLSKALRNRFTEIWCSFDADEKDVLAIIKARFDQSGSLPEEVAKLCGKFLSKYLVEFYSKFGKYLRHKLCVRDVVVVAEMLSNFVKTAAIEPAEALYHTISSHVLDSLPIICNGYHIRMVDELTHLGKELFLSIYEGMTATRLEISTLETMSILEDSGNFKVGPFSVPKGPFPPSSLNEFNINAKSTALNALRVARGFAAGKPIMLEGMPGSGKSSLIGALAQVSGNHLIRLNLSDQTEVTDLFGSDVPITLPDGTVSFTWKDGPILKALKEGSWVLLDEMNLAPQAILEALNSCFDFRKTLYISELGRSFVVDSEKPALFFACQNPERMGGNRHSLPKSFLNRFVTIFTKDMDDEDFKSIVNFVVKKAGLKQDAEVFIRIHSFCNERISVRKGSGVPGAPLEYNLRDLMRFIDCSKKCDILSSLDLVYLARLWNVRDRINYRNEISQSVLNLKTTPCPVVLALKDENLKILEWDFKADFSTDFKPLSCQLKILQNLVICVEGGLLALLVGPASCGKEKLVTFTSQLFRTRLNVIKLNSETDAQDLLGSYEHIVDADAVKECVERVVHLSNTKKLPDHVNYLIEALKTVKSNSESRTLINLLVKETEGSDIGQTLLQISHEISRATLSFDWIDSDFVRAYSEGHWVLIKDVNCCSAAVLDRLNNCLERDGELVLSEKVDGEFRVLKRHPNFRVFLTMRPENGNISSAMRNRTAEIRFDRQECWVSSWVDTLRLLPTNMGHLVTQLQSLEGGISGLHSDMAGFMKTMNLPLSSRLSMFGLTSEDDDCPNSLITDAVSSFYHVSWFLETFAFDRNMICLISRIVGGLSLTYSHVLLSSDPQQIFPADFWEESFLMDPISDLTVFGAMDASIDTGRKQYVISHLVSFILSENLKPNHPSSLVLTSVDLEPKTIPSVLIEVYRPFLDYLQTHTETLNVKFLFFGYVFIKFIKSEWNRDIGDVIGLEIIQILHQFNHSEKVESAFLKSLNDVLVMVKVDVDKPPCNSLPDVMPFTTSAQVNAAKARLDSVMVRLDVPDKIMDVLKFQMKILIESLKSVLILNFEHGFLDTYTRMLSYFPIQDRQLLLKMQLIALLRTRVNLGGTNFFISDVIQSDALNPLINLFWKRLGFRTNVNELKVLELVNFDGLLKELIDDVSIFTCLIYQVKAKVTDFVNEFYPEEDTPSELERVKKMMPVDLIDPVLKQYASKEINNQLKQVLDTLSQILRTYGRNVFGSTEDFEMCFTSLSERSSRLSCDLHCLAQENKKALVELEKLGERVRPPNTKFFQLCRLIEMFMGQMEKFFELGEDKIKLAVFHNAVNRHVDQLTSSFWEYPDIITPYVSAIFELELSLLLKYSSVDDSTMTSLLDGFDWIESTNVNARIEWLSREISSFPLRLQTQMIREALFIERIRPGSTIFMALDWLKVQWQRWYQSVQKKKAALFEYKTTQMKKRETEGKLGEDGTQYVDEEMIEIEQMLPDFSAKAEVKFTEQMNELNVLSEDEMLGLIKSVLQLEYPLDEINLYGPMLNKSDRSLITLKSANLDVHLAALLQLKSNVAEKRTDILNVYKYNSPPLLIDCVTKLQKLIDRVNTLIKSFPESNILKNIIVAVNSFFDTSSCHPQMMYTSLLEAVLEKAEFWEANTCREYSLSDLLLPLKEVILDWRKMEVVCWSDIIRQAQTTSHNNAVLSSWPMFEAFTNFEDVSEDYEKKLLVMLIQWLNDSSLNDFIARIETGEMAVAWMERAGKRNNILSKLRSIIYYHRQFVDATKERARPALDEAEEKLQNLVKVAKYTDLNLWSVKDSSQRVHNQICRLIHAYKVELNKPANSIFLDSILPIPKSLSTWISNMEWDLLKGRSSGPFTDFIENLQRILSRSYACEEGHQLIDTAKALFEQIQHDVDYSVAKNTCNSDDKEEIEKVKQKMFSKEMLKRRRTFADLRKKTINFGFNYRKGLTIETDRLTEVTMTSFDQTSDETVSFQDIWLGTVFYVNNKCIILDDDKDDNGGEDDKEPDWDMGDVMEEEEKQIDPRLWDQEKKNPDNMDDEEQGAQEETGETVAQAEEASGKGLEQDETVEEDNENREENHDETEMENVDAVDLDDDEDPQNEGDEENMELDSTGNEEEAQKDEMDITETEDIDETEEAESKDGEQAQSIETDGKGTGQAEKNVQETNESLENQGEEEGLNEEEGESGVEGYEKQKKENAGPNDAIKDSQDVEISKVHEDEEAEQVHQSQVVQGEENDAIDETQKTFAEKSDVDLSSAAHYVQKSTTVEKSKEMASEKINNEIREENQNMGERTKEFNAQLEQRHILDTFYLNTTVDVGTVIRAQDAIDSLKEFMACLDGGDEKHQLEKKWQFISQSVTTDAFELAEALRILIEPTKASKFQGDYRSGKRLNMRRLIPYIASNYQKNKIWMRRTKPAKRTVHVCLAIDDSYSMRENMMTEITCQTVCLLEKSFKQLEIGQVSICKFGMDVEMLCGSAELSDMDVVGPSLLKNLQFSQTKTDLQALLVKMGEFFGSSRQVSEASHQLLIIIGDGRGAMVNGAEPIKNQVQHLVNNGVTTLYLIVDNPTSSVFSMKVANRVSEKMQLSNYMDLFPFSFYSVVQNAAVIPLAVSEALKQWMDALML
uniref:Midasin n=1 Tax=Bursaphelenchus xylophilus TaxID=6326 RepID=A0A1I7RXZ7_BURXY